jgi:hypothetical protein
MPKNVRPRNFYALLFLTRVGSLQSTNCATSAGWIGSEWIEAGTEGAGLHQRMAPVERSLQGKCRSSRRSESQSSLPALHSSLPSLSSSFGTWGILARVDPWQVLFSKHDTFQSRSLRRLPTAIEKSAEEQGVMSLSFAMCSEGQLGFERKSKQKRGDLTLLLVRVELVLQSRYAPDQGT